MAKETYEGRLMGDGSGHLLAYEARQVGTKTVVVHDADGEPVVDENGTEVTMSIPVFKFGKKHGKQIAHDPESDTYVFVKDGEPSHNERHHVQTLEIQGTQSNQPTEPGYAGTQDEPTPGMEHHWGPLEDDPHYSEGATDGLERVTNTRPLSDPDSVAPLVSSHTSQHRGAA